VVAGAGAQQLGAGAQHVGAGAQHVDLHRHQACALSGQKARLAEQSRVAAANLIIVILLSRVAVPQEAKRLTPKNERRSRNERAGRRNHPESTAFELIDAARSTNPDCVFQMRYGNSWKRFR
jgi:hypothetical protein